MSQSGSGPLDPAPQIRDVPLDAVLTRVKQEVGLFYSDEAKSEANWHGLLNDLNVTPVCGDGHIAFEITSVRMDFLVTNDQTGQIGGGLKLPFGIPIANGSFGPGLTGSDETAGTMDLVYTYRPLASGPVSDDFNAIRENAIILPALDHLRDSLIRTTGHTPCFKSRGAGDADQTLTFSVAVTKDVTGSLGFNFALLNLSASRDKKNSASNTITVSYRPVLFTSRAAPAKPKGK
jgi:hypothetical protein